MSSLELVAVVFSLVSVLAAGRRHVVTWPAGIIGVLAYFAVFLDARLYADMALQIVFLIQCVDGWRTWRRVRGVVGAPLVPVRRLSGRPRLLGGLGIVVAILLVGAGLSRWTNAAAPYLDATVATLSLVANGLLARRVLENWILWVLADALYVWLFLSRGLHLSAALYVVFFGLAVLGWRRWVRDDATERAQSLRPVDRGAAPPAAA